MPQIKPRAFFFDFDGVICDTEKLHMVAALRVAKGQGLGFSEEYYFDELLGFDDRGLFEHLFSGSDKPLSNELLKDMIVKKNHVLMEAFETELVFFKGVKDLILRLRDCDVPLAVVSGALSGEVEAALKQGGLREHFEFLVCADHVQRSKPHPEPYQKAYEMMTKERVEILPEECWVLEDSPAGVRSANSAGMKCIGVLNSVPKLALRETEFVVKGYEEIEVV